MKCAKNGVPIVRPKVNPINLPYLSVFYVNSVFESDYTNECRKTLSRKEALKAKNIVALS